MKKTFNKYLIVSLVAFAFIIIPSVTKAAFDQNNGLIHSHANDFTSDLNPNNLDSLYTVTSSFELNPPASYNCNYFLYSGPACDNWSPVYIYREVYNSSGTLVVGSHKEIFSVANFGWWGNNENIDNIEDEVRVPGGGWDFINNLSPGAYHYKIYFKNENACIKKVSGNCTDSLPYFTDIPVGQYKEVLNIPFNLVFPDLVASAPTQTTATTGVAQTISSTISTVYNSNSLAMATNGSFKNILQIATGQNGSGNINSVLKIIYNNLDISHSSEVISTSYTFPTAGAYSVRACADKSSASDAGTVYEWNASGTGESNNCSAWTNVTVTDEGAFGETTPAPTLRSAHASVTVTVIDNICTYNSDCTVAGQTCVAGKCGIDPTSKSCTDNSSCLCSNGNICGGGGLGSSCGGVVDCAKGTSCGSDNKCVAVLTAEKSPIFKGKSTTLRWNSSTGYTCNGIGFSTAGSNSGNVSVSPTVTTPYTITCTGTDLITLTGNVTVKVIDPIIIEN